MIWLWLAIVGSVSATIGFLIGAILCANPRSPLEDEEQAAALRGWVDTHK